MKNRAKQWIGSLLAVCLVMAMLPTAALAADTGKAIQLVSEGSAGNLGGGQADNIYFGTYEQSSDGSGGYNLDPIKWRVLSNASGQLFLLSDQNLDVFQYHTEEETVTWETSTMRSWLNGYGASSNTGGSSGIDYTGDNFLDAAFSAKEQNAIVETAVVNDDNSDYGTDGGNNTTDRIFLLSISDVCNRNYFPSYTNFSTNTAYVAAGGKLGSGMYGAGEADRWWLRSPGSNNSMAAFIEDDGGDVYEGNPVNNKTAAVRPAFNLNLSDVLFTSAATGGKSASGMDSGLTAVQNYSGKDWKLTLLDSSRNSRAGIRGSSPYGRQLADGLVVRARPAELCGACGLRDAVAPETGKLNPETPEGRRLKPPFFLGSPLKQPGVGEFIGRGRGRYREWLQCHSRRMFCFGACLFRWAYRCS